MKLIQYCIIFQNLVAFVNFFSKSIFLQLLSKAYTKLGTKIVILGAQRLQQLQPVWFHMMTLAYNTPLQLQTYAMCRFPGLRANVSRTQLADSADRPGRSARLASLRQTVASNLLYHA